MKILGSGEVTKKLAVTAHGFSQSAKEKIEAAGGSVTWLRGEPAPKKPKQPKVRRRVAAEDEPEAGHAEEALPAETGEPASPTED